MTATNWITLLAPLAAAILSAAFTWWISQRQIRVQHVSDSLTRQTTAASKFIESFNGSSEQIVSKQITLTLAGLHRRQPATDEEYAILMDFVTAKLLYVGKVMGHLRQLRLVMEDRDVIPIIHSCINDLDNVRKQITDKTDELLWLSLVTQKPISDALNSKLARISEITQDKLVDRTLGVTVKGMYTEYGKIIKP